MRLPKSLAGKLVLLAILATLLGGLVWLASAGGSATRPPTPEELAATPDAALEPRVIAFLAHRLGGKTSGWRDLPEPARHLWAVRACEGMLTNLGWDALAEQARDNPAFPTVEEAKAGYTAMGLGAAAKALATVAKTGTGPLAAAIADPQAVAKRTAWLRAHLAAITGG